MHDRLQDEAPRAETKKHSAHLIGSPSLARPHSQVAALSEGAAAEAAVVVEPRATDVLAALRTPAAAQCVSLDAGRARAGVAVTVW